MYFHSRTLPKKSKGSTTKSFGTLRLKSFDGKSWCHPIMHQSFSLHQNFWDIEGFSAKFSQLWEKKLMTEKPDTAPFLHKFFLFWKFSEKLKFSPRFFFAAVRQKCFDETVIHPISNFLSEPEHFRVTMIPLRFFSVMWDKKSSPENCDTLLFCPKIFFDSRNFLKHRRFFPRRISALRLEIFDGKSQNSPIKHSFFQTRIFRYSETKTSMEYCDISRLCIKFFHTRIFLRHCRVLWENFATVRKKLNTEKRDTAALFHKFFPY